MISYGASRGPERVGQSFCKRSSLTALPPIPPPPPANTVTVQVVRATAGDGPLTIEGTGGTKVRVPGWDAVVFGPKHCMPS